MGSPDAAVSLATERCDADACSASDKGGVALDLDFMILRSTGNEAEGAESDLACFVSEIFSSN
jgi:hypothetical protein